MKASDENIVVSIRRGGKALAPAREALYTKYRDAVLNNISIILHQWGGRQEDARDFLHDAFLIMIEKIRFGGYKKGALIHFWTGIARGLISNRLKKDKRMTLTGDETVFEGMTPLTPEDVIIDNEQKAYITALLSTFGSRCLRVLKLWMQGFSMKEIAEEVSLSSEAMARKVKYQCMKKLVAEIEEHALSIKDKLT